MNYDVMHSSFHLVIHLENLSFSVLKDYISVSEVAKSFIDPIELF